MSGELWHLKTPLAERPAPADFFYVLDRDDTTESANGTAKGIEYQYLAPLAVSVTFTPAGAIAATNVQAALEELDGEKQPLDAGLTSIAGLTTAADRMVYTTGSDAYAVTVLTAAGRALVDDASAADQRTTLGLAIGTHVQAWDADLDALAALTSPATTLGTALQPADIASGAITPRADGIDFSGGADGDVLTVQADGSLAVEAPPGAGSFALDDATDVTITDVTTGEILAYDGAAWINRTLAEANIQPLDAELTAIAALAATDGNFIVGNGSTWVAESGSTARASLGVDPAGTDNSTDVTLAGSLDYITIAGQEITRNAIDLAADVTGTLPVANGGTGATTHSSGNFLVGAGAGAVTSAKAAPSGVVVGTTDGQTLTGKTITFADNTLTNVMSLTTAQSVTAGVKKTLQADATNAGLRLAGVTADPSSLTAGDIWYRSDAEKISYRGASGARSLVAEALTQTLTNKTLAGVTLSGAAVCADQIVSAPELRDVAETVQTATGVNGSISYAYTAGAILDLALTGAVTSFAITAPPATGKAGAVTVILRNTNGLSFAWPTGTKWAGGTPPTLNAGATAIDIYSLVTLDAGTTWFGFVGGKAFA